MKKLSVFAVLAALLLCGCENEMTIKVWKGNWEEPSLEMHLPYGYRFKDCDKEETDGGYSVTLYFEKVE